MRIAVTHKTFNFIVEFNYWPGYDEVHTLPNGDPGYPGEPEECEITAAFFKGVNVFDLFQVFGWDADALEIDTLAAMRKLADDEFQESETYF